MISKEAIVEIKGINVLTTVQNLTALIIEQEAEGIVDVYGCEEVWDGKCIEWLAGLVTAYAFIIGEDADTKNVDAFISRLWKKLNSHINYESINNELGSAFSEDALFECFYNDLVRGIV